MKRYILSLMLILFAVSAYSQVEKNEIRKGNKAFEKEKYQESEIEYRKALLKDSLSLIAKYNLANTLYKTDRAPEAERILAPLQDTVSGNEAAPDFYHNLANFYLVQKKYGEAVEAYKNSLRKRPGDMETKTNLAYAQKMLENQQNQDQNQDQNQNNQNQNNQNQDQNQNDQNQDQNDQNKNNPDNDGKQNNDRNDQNNQNNQNNQNDQNGNGKQQSGNEKISPQAAQQMLRAIDEKEKQTQEKVKKEKALLMKSKQKEKNW